MTWTLATAKDRLSEVIRQARDLGPQTISVRGEDAAVVLSKSDFQALLDQGMPRGFKDLLLQLDLDGVDLNRDQTPVLDLEL